MTIRCIAAGRPARERGAGMVEYALLVSLIAGVAIGAVSAAGEGTAAAFGQIPALAGAGAESEPTPEEKWEQAREAYDQALADAKAQYRAELARAKAKLDAARQENKSLPKADRKAANNQAKAEYDSARSQAKSSYDSARSRAKAAYDKAKAEYKASS